MTDTITDNKTCLTCRWSVTNNQNTIHPGCGKLRKKFGIFNGFCLMNDEAWEPLLKVGDKVYVRDNIDTSNMDDYGHTHFDYTKCRINKEMVRFIGKEVQITGIFNDNCGELRCKAEGWSWHQAWLTYKNPSQKDKTFVVDHHIKSEGNKLSNLSWVPSEEVDGHGMSLQQEYSKWSDISGIKTLMRNIDWLIDEGFIKEKEKVVEVEGKKEFEPFDITFRVECKKDLMSMLDALGSAPSDISDNSIHDCYEYWDLVDDKVSELGLKMG